MEYVVSVQQPAGDVEYFLVIGSFLGPVGLVFLEGIIFIYEVLIRALCEPENDVCGLSFGDYRDKLGVLPEPYLAWADYRIESRVRCIRHRL